MSKKDLKAIAAKALKQYPTSDRCWVTTDGQAFLSENYANLHASSNSSGKRLSVLTFDRAGLLKDINVNAEKVSTKKDDRAKAEVAAKAEAKAKAEAEAKAKAEADAKAKADAKVKAEAAKAKKTTPKTTK